LARFGAATAWTERGPDALEIGATSTTENDHGGPFGAQSTTDEVLAGVNLSGKRILVTGVSAAWRRDRPHPRRPRRPGGRAARDLAKARTATEPVRARRRTAAASSWSSWIWLR